MNYLKEDVGIVDLTTMSLKIGSEVGTISFAPKNDIVLSGVEFVQTVLDQTSLDYEWFANDGQHLKAGEKILVCSGKAKDIHKIWKISQNIFEYASGIATLSNQLVQKAQKHNPNITVATTRKNLPGAKEFMLKAIMDGGALPHRLGLYDSILIFQEHLEFIPTKEELEQRIIQLKTKYIEKKISIEVNDFEDAQYFASLGLDILQCEKMDKETLTNVIKLKKNYPNLLISATGGVNLSNIEEFAKLDVDFIVTSCVYHAKPQDIKVTIARKA